MRTGHSVSEKFPDYNSQGSWDRVSLRGGGGCEQRQQWVIFSRSEGQAMLQPLRWMAAGNEPGHEGCYRRAVMCVLASLLGGLMASFSDHRPDPGTRL